MKKTKKRILALLLAVLLVMTSAPFSFAYQNGEVVEDDGTETVVGIPAEEQSQFPGAGTVVEEDLPTLVPGSGQVNNSQTTGQEVPAAEYASDGVAWQMEEISLDQEAMDVMRGTTGRKTSTLSLPAQTKKVHYYRTVESFLTGANGKKFSITGDQVWNNTYIKVVVPLKADGSEDLANATAAYCLNAHLASPGENMSNAGLAGLSDKQSIIIGDILALGYKEASGHTIPREDWYKWTITQIMIWAVRGGTLQYNTKTGVNELTGQNVSGIDDFKKQLYSLAEYVGGGQYDAWNSYADYLLYNVLNLRKLPQFAYKTEAEAKDRSNVIRLDPNSDATLYVMGKESQGYFVDTTNDKYDKNGVTFYNYTAKKTKNPSAAANVAPELVSDFQYDQHGIDGLQIRWRVEADCYAGPIYGLQFTSNRELPDPVVSQKMTREIYGGKSAALVYSDGGGGSTSQYIAAYTPVKETLNAYFAVTTGSVSDNPVSSGIRKESEDGVVAGIQFTLTGNGKTFTKTTDSNGNIDISDLPLYKQKDKTDEDGNVLTNPDGTNQTEDDLDNPITYTVRENVPVRYVIPAEQGTTITPAEGGGVTFHNVLKKWKISFTKADPQATAGQKNRHNGAEGDATLAGAEYGLYCNGVLIDTFFTDENGQFETWEYYPCGSADGPLHYTIREINPSPGYLLNTAEISLSTDPASYSQEFNVAPAASGTEQIIKGDIYLTKHTDKGETGIEEPEVGAKFQIYLRSSGSYENALPEERDLLTIDADGHARSKKLPYGVYIVHQIEGWEYKEMVDDFEVFISQDGKTYDFILNNRPFEALVTIMKKDKDSGRVIPMSGVGFKVRNRKTGQFVVQHINYPTPRDLSVFYTDVTGKLMMPEKLEGGEYELIEVVAAYGYVLDPTPVPFVIDGTLKEIVVEKSNQAQMSALQIYKHGQVFSAVQEGWNEFGKTYQPIYSDGYLKGAVYEVHAMDNVTTPDGTLRYVAGQLVDTITTDEDGMAISKPLYLGHYYVMETKAPAGYILDSTMKQVTLSYSDSTQEVTLTTVHLEDEKQPVSVDIPKLMEEDRDFGYKMQKGVENVQFGLFAAEEIETVDGKQSIPADGLIEVGTVNSGRVTFEFHTDLPFGNYYLKELATDNAYLLKGEKWPFIVEPVPGTQKRNVIHATNGKDIVNELKRGGIHGEKLNEDGEVLPGALFGLFLPGETEFTEENAIRTALSDENGGFDFTDLPYGSYIVREISTPEGFVLTETVFPVIIHEDGQMGSFTVENKYIKSDIVLEKVDKDYSGTRLTGAEFTLYRDPEKSGIVTEDSEVVGVLEETEKGIYTMKEVRYGNYLIVETKAPEYFYADKTPIPVTVKEDGEVIRLTKPNRAIVGSLRIRKVSEDGVVAGIKFTVSGRPYAGGFYEEEFETDENGEIVVDNLRIGEYTVSEVLDESTIKYRVEDPKNVTVTSGSTVEVEFYNQLRRGSIYVIKTDPDYPESKLSGAEFTVYRDEDYDGKFDPSIDRRVVTLQEDGGLYWTEDLEAGSYFLRETKAPEGYVLDTEYHYFEIDKDTQQIEITNTIDENAGFVNRKITGSLKIIKKSASSDKPLQGANFCVYNAEGEVVAEGTTNENGEVLFEGLPYGNYTYQEISAPAGFERDRAEHPFSIKLDGKVIEVTAINHKTPFYVPQTGDGKVNPTFWLTTLAFISGLGAIVTTGLLMRKRKKSRSN